MTENFQFTLKKTDGGAVLAKSPCRAASIRTPAFMPVGTVGTVKAMYLDQVRDARRRYHARQHLPPDAAPDAERVARLGGLHKLIRWPHPILTDSGGFQVMSLSGCASSTRRA
jgi:queuine tRNA-ribosyltransferase